MEALSIFYCFRNLPATHAEPEANKPDGIYFAPKVCYCLLARFLIQTIKKQPTFFLWTALFSLSPIPATMISIYMRWVAVLKSPDFSFLVSWRGEQPHFLTKKNASSFFIYLLWYEFCRANKFQRNKLNFPRLTRATLLKSPWLRLLSMFRSKVQLSVLSTQSQFLI